MIPPAALQKLSSRNARTRKQGLRQMVNYGTPQELAQVYNQLQPQLMRIWGALDDEEKSLYVTMSQAESASSSGVGATSNEIAHGVKIDPKTGKPITYTAYDAAMSKEAKVSFQSGLTAGALGGAAVGAVVSWLLFGRR